jgi:molybdopterin converting factor subunit 1
VHVQVLYFAMIRQRVGCDSETFELADGADVRAVRGAIAERHPELAGVLSRVATAVNRTIAADTVQLGDGDEIALIPPVAGGSARLSAA